jgi:hypothetical protein
MSNIQKLVSLFDFSRKTKSTTEKKTENPISAKSITEKEMEKPLSEKIDWEKFYQTDVWGENPGVKILVHKINYLLEEMSKLKQDK